METSATFTTVSPLLIEKAITGSIGEVKSICKMRSGDLFIEVSLAKQATVLIKLQKLAHLDIIVAPHSNLNFSRGVISPVDFLHVSTEEIAKNMKAQKVCDVRRLKIRWDGQILNTKHLILTFSTPDLPQTVKMTHIRCPVRPYIPNPLLCFQCQRYGHSKNVCLSQPTCPRLGESGHDSADCTKKEQCRHDVLFLSRTPVSGKSYASAARKGTSDKSTQCNAEEDDSSDSVTPTKPERATKEPKGDNRPTIPKIPKKTSRDFHQKIEEDTVTGDCSEEDETLMDYELVPSTSSSGGGESAVQ
ncbi:uncharacterized protein TNCV_3479681 [Trichonephila clavipes]|nr:uncharacterized protein TNCV_3479681 [Trichonephila clavipes]